MSQAEQNSIRIVVDDEQALYDTFSPEDEFSEPVKSYIKSQLSCMDRYKSFNMTVIAHESLDEERFRTAMLNWTRNTKAMNKQAEKKTIRTLIGMLAFGSIMLVITISLQQQIVELKYSLMPIMATFGLNNAVNIMIKEMPDISLRKWVLNEMEKHNVITFEYGNDKKDTSRSENQEKRQR